MTRIATFIVNGVNGRLPVLLKWLSETDYDIVCLQELKTSERVFPAAVPNDLGLSYRRFGSVQEVIRWQA